MAEIHKNSFLKSKDSKRDKVIYEQGYNEVRNSKSGYDEP
jgi:hypothetical protein